MTLTTKFKKDLQTLRAAVDKEIFLDVKNPKLYKKVKKYYEKEGLVKFTGDHFNDYDIMIEVIAEDLASTYSQTANPHATNSEFDGYR